MAKNIKDLKLEEVYRALSAIWQMNEPHTIQAVAKELGVNKVDFYYFVTDQHKWHFKVSEGKDEKLYIMAYYENDFDNPENPDYVTVRKAKYPKLLLLTTVEDYGSLLGWELREDTQGPEYGKGWRNTAEKIKQVRDAGLLKDTTFCFGWFGDGHNETKLGFRTEDKDKVLQAFKDAGWDVRLQEHKVRQ